jgi:hypothetical protein
MQWDYYYKMIDGRLLKTNTIYRPSIGNSDECVIRAREYNGTLYWASEYGSISEAMFMRLELEESVELLLGARHV